MKSSSLFQRYTFLVLFCFSGILPVFCQSPDSLMIRQIYSTALTTGTAYTNLYTLCKQAPARLSGSANAAKAVDLTLGMVKLVSDNAWLQETMVPHWERGEKETATVTTNKKNISLNVLALGGSEPTPATGVTAGVIEVSSLEELRSLDATRVMGKIVFINQKMDPTHIDTFHAYGGCAGIRVNGADEAAEKGAVAVIIRSVGLRDDDHPHTGVMMYKKDKKIPAAALSTNDANKLSDLLKKDPRLSFSLKMSCKSFPDEKSYNVIGEIKGSEHPEEIILVGGHLDSWDNCEGAQDDGAGVVQSIEVLSILKQLGITPKRTIRCVLFMNEENGARGAATYAEQAALKGEKHIVAIESDRGGFSPRGFSYDANEPALGLCIARLEKWKHLFAPYFVHLFTPGFGGVDIHRLKDQGAALFGFIPDSQRYFDIHHAAEDKFENVNKRELELGAATITALIYLFSEYGMGG